LSTQDLNLALSAAEKASKADPAYAEPQLLAAIVHLRRGETELARAAAQRARALDPKLELPPEISALMK
jgi:Flp pilus assembly protein TadD